MSEDSAELCERVLYPHPVRQGEYGVLASTLRAEFLRVLDDLSIDAALLPPHALEAVYLPLADWVARRQLPGQVCVIGINGAQGSGKSSLTRLLVLLLRMGFNKRVLSFSIDDLYKTRAERQALAREVHPLLATRGVPGTHDVEQALVLMQQMRRGVSSQEYVRIPVFDKLLDDRLPVSSWQQVNGPLDIVLFEGWCVGSIAQADADLVPAINALERSHDANGCWRAYVNQQLAGPYQDVFAHIDALIMLKVPDFAHVLHWRAMQEERLAGAGAGGAQRMSLSQLQHFIMHYERLTRWSLKEMPGRADLLVHIDDAHQVSKICERTP